MLGAEIIKGNMMGDCIEMFKCPFVKIYHRQDKENSKELQCIRLMGKFSIRKKLLYRN